MTSQKPLTVKDVAGILEVTDEEIRRLCREGLLRSTKHGNAYLIWPDDVAEYQKNRRKPGRPQKTA